jgi:hypothetical protein
MPLLAESAPRRTAQSLLEGLALQRVGCQNSITPLTLEFARGVPQLAL